MKALPPDDELELDLLGRVVASRWAAHYSVPQEAGRLAVQALIRERGDAAVVEMLERLGTASPERRLLGRFLLAAWDVFADEPFLARDLVAPPVRRPALEEIVEALAPAGSPESTRVHQVAQFLARHAGVSVDGYHLETAGDRRGSTLWAVCAVE
jgi:hypothetical protein